MDFVSKDKIQTSNAIMIFCDYFKFDKTDFSTSSRDLELQWSVVAFIDVPKMSGKTFYLTFS